MAKGLKSMNFFNRIQSISFNEIKVFFSCKIFFKKNQKVFISGTSEFETFIIENKLFKIKDLFLPLLQRCKIRRDIYLFEIPTVTPIAIGYNRKETSNSKAAVVMPEGLYDLDPMAFSFLLKHELSHIKYFDVLLSRVIPLTGALIGLMSLTPFVGVFFAYVIAYFLFIPVLDHFIGRRYMIFRESQADVFACKHSEVEEIEGAIYYFLAILQFNKKRCSIFPQFNEDGDLKKNRRHPRLSERITLLKKVYFEKTKKTFDESSQRVASMLALLEENETKLKE